MGLVKLDFHRSLGLLVLYKRVVLRGDMKGNETYKNKRFYQSKKMWNTFVLLFKKTPTTPEEYEFIKEEFGTQRFEKIQITNTKKFLSVFFSVTNICSCNTYIQNSHS